MKDQMNPMERSIALGKEVKVSLWIDYLAILI